MDICYHKLGKCTCTLYIKDSLSKILGVDHSESFMIHSLFSPRNDFVLRNHSAVLLQHSQHQLTKLSDLFSTEHQGSSLSLIGLRDGHKKTCVFLKLTEFPDIYCDHCRPTMKNWFKIDPNLSYKN